MSERVMKMNATYYAAIGAGGMIGAALRYGVSLLFDDQYSYFPFATLLINLTGCFLLGFIFHHPNIKNNRIPELVYRVITVGVIGSFTTFSTVTIEIVNLWAQNTTAALVYTLLSLFGGVLMAYTGVKLAQGRRV
ncbi:fluoride efflux transporter FluC [Virgibacillus sp. W0181]|uniref:fluoride efflux transporter FluC n=1 Tax=Virgibacillus sp. W0181 TaxID=3391581 RepID=UPI003F465246